MLTLFLGVLLLSSWALMLFAYRMTELEKLELQRQVKSLRRRLVEEPASQDVRALVQHPSKGLFAWQSCLCELTQKLHAAQPQALDAAGLLMPALHDSAQGLEALRVALKLTAPAGAANLSEMLATLAHSSEGPSSEAAAQATVPLASLAAMLERELAQEQSRLTRRRSFVPPRGKGAMFSLDTP